MELKVLTPDNFTEFIQSETPVMVDFFATWCESCKFMLPILGKIAAEQDKEIIGTVDVDDYRDLAVEYGVKSIPALMIFQNGELKETSIGRVSKDKVLELLGLQ